jgi:hypothetical protein
LFLKKARKVDEAANFVLMQLNEQKPQFKFVAEERMHPMFSFPNIVFKYPVALA